MTTSRSGCGEGEGEVLSKGLLIETSYPTYYRPQRSCGKVIFSQACVKNSVNRGWGVSASVHGGIHPPPGQTPPGQTPPSLGRPPWADTPRADTLPDGHCSGRYVSYWNAFLLKFYIRHLLQRTIPALRSATLVFNNCCRIIYTKDKLPV